MNNNNNMDINEFNDQQDKELETSKNKQNMRVLAEEVMTQLNDQADDFFMSFSLNKEEGKKSGSEEPLLNQASLDQIKSFDLNPKKIKSYLDDYVIGQDACKKALSVAICDHYNYIKEVFSSGSSGEYTKQNILMIGPTGVGKTYIIKRIAELIGVPFVKGDATKYTETGYQGGDVDDLVRQLFKKANENPNLAEVGIIYLDEVDKISGVESSNVKDVSGKGVQTNLLKLIEDTDVILRPPWDIQSQIQFMMEQKKQQEDSVETIKTKHILFIMSGAFNNLDEIIKKRLKGANIGFERNKQSLEEAEKTKNLIQNVNSQDLMAFGLEPEFVGRLPVQVGLDSLTVMDLFHILSRSKGSILEHYISTFKRFEIEICFDHDALMEISAMAYEEKTGARGLSTQLEKIFRDYKFQLPSTDTHYVFVNKALVENPEHVLNLYLTQSEKMFVKVINDSIDFILEGLDLNIDRKKIVNECLSESSKGRVMPTIKLMIAQQC